MPSFQPDQQGAFLSTPSVRRATVSSPRCAPAQTVFLSTPSARRATLSRLGFCRWQSISIHALREEGDCASFSTTSRRCDFYPRPPRGGRLGKQIVRHISVRFLSTPSARRATAIVLSCASFLPYFYPRPPRGGRLPTLTRTTPPLSHFYPRPPRGGRLARRYIPSLIA